MTKLLLNTGPVPLHTASGAPIQPGGIVLDDELADDWDAAVLAHVKPSELPEDLGQAVLSEAALEHVWRGRNADSGSGDDSTVSTGTRRGARS